MKTTIKNRQTEKHYIIIFRKPKEKFRNKNLFQFCRILFKNLDLLATKKEKIQLLQTSNTHRYKFNNKNRKYFNLKSPKQINQILDKIFYNQDSQKVDPFKI